ncbi:hypothetical protein B0T25DRAFT_259209 [Lasiosphaeria hispida]|uniref:Uncharacterized protein n=1 Tax=Lasiosphaeria hispida TaxID=260671 RepID=A0AAJ0HFZ7_9PEZI|nr:hypothetical protein B0T25DRAFT_259209 [Lasiosphaeria hispida]
MQLGSKKPRLEGRCIIPLWSKAARSQVGHLPVLDRRTTLLCFQVVSPILCWLMMHTIGVPASWCLDHRLPFRTNCISSDFWTALGHGNGADQRSSLSLARRITPGENDATPDYLTRRLSDWRPVGGPAGQAGARDGNSKTMGQSNAGGQPRLTLSQLTRLTLTPSLSLVVGSVSVGHQTVARRKRGAAKRREPAAPTRRNATVFGTAYS